MTENSQRTTDNWPAVTCLCPTYGRFERLRDAVACFLLQDYPGERHLYIENDAPERLQLCRGRMWSMLTYDIGARVKITLQQNGVRFKTLGHKRQALLENAYTPLIAHWDDDDLYLPWHLTQCVETLLREDVGCAKPRAAWWAVGPPDGFEVRGPCHNVFEGQMVFRREAALELGGYPPKVSGQAKVLLGIFRRVGDLYTWNPPYDRISYVYRWADGLCHISGGGNNQQSHKAFGQSNQDFGDGRPLIPPDALPADWARDRLADQFQRLAREAGCRRCLDTIGTDSLYCCRGPSAECCAENPTEG